MFHCSSALRVSFNLSSNNWRLWTIEEGFSVRWKQFSVLHLEAKGLINKCMRRDFDYWRLKTPNKLEESGKRKREAKRTENTEPTDSYAAFLTCTQNLGGICKCARIC